MRQQLIGIVRYEVAVDLATDLIDQDDPIAVLLSISQPGASQRLERKRCRKAVVGRTNDTRRGGDLV